MCCTIWGLQRVGYKLVIEQQQSILYKGLDLPQILVPTGFHGTSLQHEITLLQAAERNQQTENLKSAHMCIINKCEAKSVYNRTYVAIQMSNVNCLQGRVL